MAKGAKDVQLRLTDVVSQYEGKTDFEEWKKKFELVAKLQGITELSAALPLFLTGDAFSVYDGLSPSSKADYKAVTAALKRAFSVNAFSAFELFVGRRYRAGEAVDVYLSDLIRLGRLVTETLDDAWLKCAFVQGLPDEVKTQMKAAAAIDAMPLDQVVERARTIISVSESSHTGAAAIATSARRSANRRGRQLSRSCFLCGEAGHLARDCDSRAQRVKCFRCGEVGHRIANCSSAPKNE